MKYSRYLGLMLLLLIENLGFSQTPIYSESFTSVTPPNLPGGWLGIPSSNIFSINNTPSNGYSGASGTINLLAQNCTPNGDFRTFHVSGINASNAAGLSISFGHRRTSAFDAVVSLEWSSDDINWGSIGSYSVFDAPVEPNPTWVIAGPFALPSSADYQSNLRFRWSYTTNTNHDCTNAVPNYRIDDFIVYATTLPIELTMLSATSNEDFIYLNWQTASELNNSHFSIEKSLNGKDFSEIGELPGFGTTLETHDYSFTDTNPVSGNNYYRLKQVDFDDQFSYSKVVSVKFKDKNKAYLFPTVSKDKLTIRFSYRQTEESSAFIFDQLGCFVQLVAHDTFEGSQQSDIDISYLPSGTYFLKIQQGRSSETLRFTKI